VSPEPTIHCFIGPGAEALRDRWAQALGARLGQVPAVFASVHGTAAGFRLRGTGADDHLSELGDAVTAARDALRRAALASADRSLASDDTPQAPCSRPRVRLVVTLGGTESTAVVLGLLEELRGDRRRWVTPPRIDGIFTLPTAGGVPEEDAVRGLRWVEGARERGLLSAACILVDQEGRSAGADEILLLSILAEADGVDAIFGDAMVAVGITSTRFDPSDAQRALKVEFLARLREQIGASGAATSVLGKRAPVIACDLARRLDSDALGPSSVAAAVDRALREFGVVGSSGAQALAPSRTLADQRAVLNDLIEAARAEASAEEVPIVTPRAVPDAAGNEADGEDVDKPDALGRRAAAEPIVAVFARLALVPLGFVVGHLIGGTLATPGASFPAAVLGGVAGLLIAVRWKSRIAKSPGGGGRVATLREVAATSPAAVDPSTFELLTDSLRELLARVDTWSAGALEGLEVCSARAAKRAADVPWRREDVLARYGGEAQAAELAAVEFGAIVSPDDDSAAGAAAAAAAWVELAEVRADSWARSAVEADAENDELHLPDEAEALEWLARQSSPRWPGTAQEPAEFRFATADLARLATRPDRALAGRGEVVALGVVRSVSVADLRAAATGE